MPEQPSLYEQVARFYHGYTRTVTSGDLKNWPDFFTEDCLYQATSRESIEQNLPLPLLQCEGKSMAEDRALAIMETQVFQPRRTRYYLLACRSPNCPPRTLKRARTSW